MHGERKVEWACDTMTRQVIRRRFFAVLASGLIACRPARSQTPVDAAVAEFHRRLNADDYDAIYNNLAPVYQRSLDRETHRNFLIRVRSKMGTLESTRRISYSVHRSA